MDMLKLAFRSKNRNFHFRAIKNVIFPELNSKGLRRALASKNVKAIIANRCNRKQSYSFDAMTYKRRNVVERTFYRLKDFRRFATRYDRLAATLFMVNLVPPSANN